MKNIDSQIISTQLVTFLNNTFSHTVHTKAVIAVSGGVDSATSLGLITRALGPQNVHTFFLPYGSLNHQGVVDGQLACTAFGVPEENRTTIDIQPLLESLFGLDPNMDSLRKGNMMARLRMTLLFDAAKKHKALVIGTENKTEHLLGYYTRFGDEASDVEPLRNLYKTQVYQLAQFLHVPNPVLTKAPSAGLWEGQTDEGEFGFSYKDADEILNLIFDEKKSIEDVIEYGYRKDVIENVLALVKKNEFKHLLPFISPL